ncbi:hypothetical protein L484_018532 [Morus notabilis]|uniref:Flotillin-like n=1 Tax=Morus notabilis TaxID=981085 RepID=W9SE70_9ROSA|nr:flotillin-like protein 3 [Morus notabilis]EXC24816.1 hypothetical protein L484_018532 [Morus notabilis]
MYRVAGPTEFLAITGRGIKDVKIAKKAFIWPILQKCRCFDVSPVIYNLDLIAMSVEKLLFAPQGVFIVGPNIHDKHALLLYAKLILPEREKDSTYLRRHLRGFIEGETRALAASMTMEEIFKGAVEFKKEVYNKVQLSLSEFGLVIYNANMKQLIDIKDNWYFSYIGQKMKTEAANQAKIDIAEATKKGTIGEKLRQAQTIQNAAQIDSETKIVKTQRLAEGTKGEIKVNTALKVFENQKASDVLQSNNVLAMKKAKYDKETQLANVEAKNVVDIREAELKTILEKRNAEAQTEKLNADLLSKATVNYEIKVQEANWELYKQQRAADANFYGKQKASEAQKVSAEASSFARQQVSDSDLYAKRKEAEGIIERANAERLYLNKLMKQLGGNYLAVREYMMMKNNTFQEIAKNNAQAINGLKPKISLWSQGNELDDDHELNGGGQMKGIAGVYNMVPPLLKTVHEQTGMHPPTWLGSLPNANSV